MNTETINGTKYTVKTLNTPASVSEDMKARGWDGNSYHVTGPRGAVFFGMRSARGEWNLTRMRGFR